MEKSTLEDVQDGPPRRGEWVRRIGIASLVVVLLLGLSGLLGNQNRTVTATQDGVTLSLEYPRTSRAGLEVPWVLTVSQQGGFDSQVQVRVASEYFTIYQFQGMTPVPDAETADGTYTYWTFQAPPGQDLVVELDHIIKPAQVFGAGGTAAVLIDGEPVAPIEFTTTLFP